MRDDTLSRRSFVGRMAQGAFAATIVPRHVLGGPGFLAPSDRLNIAMIGAGGMGSSNAEALVAGGMRIVALADVDYGVVQRSVESKLKDRDGNARKEGVALQQAYAKAKRYADFRQMLEKDGKNIDAVVIATPDHTHAVAAAQAMKLGKHVYVQKPLTYSVHEARALRDLAQKTKLVTQMGNQGHSTDDARKINEWVQAGVIGPVREVHAWTNRPIWPQGLPRPAQPVAAAQYPTPTAAASQWAQRNISAAIANALSGQYSPPAGLDWDVYLGPAQFVPYHPIYHPFNWRGWVDFGVGALGDMGAHLIDHPYWALGLTYPSSIEATSTPWGMDPGNKPATYPLATTVHYEFPARGGQPPVKMTWYDGGLMPPRPDVLPDTVELKREGGVIMIGDKGILLHETYGRNPQLFPEGLMQTAANVPEKYPRITTSHEMNWANAAKGQGTPTSPFSYAAPLTETMLLGIVALRTGQGKKIYYDAENMRVTNIPEANQYLQREYRAGWSL